MFESKKTVHQILLTSEKLEKFFVDFGILMENQNIPYSPKFNSYRFIVLYNACFTFSINRQILFLLTQPELNSINYKEFKKNFFFRKPIDFLKMKESQKNFNNLNSFSERQVLHTIFEFWRLASLDSIMKNYFESKNIDRSYPIVENCLLLNTIDDQENEIDMFFQVLYKLERESVFQETKFEDLSYEMSKKIHILVELLFFRFILVETFFKLNYLTFF